jgi:hypothetical protein
MPSKTTPNEIPAIRRIAELISRLLVHYWTADDPVETRTVQFEDWLEDLGQFPPVTVEEACRQWRRSRRHRPTPSDIRWLCLNIAAEQQRRLEIADRRSGEVPTWLVEIWEPLGGMEARQQAIAQQDERYRRAAEWRKEHLL